MNKKAILILSSVVIAIMSLSPFHIYASDIEFINYDVPYWQASAFFHFYGHGLDATEEIESGTLPTNYSYLVVSGFSQNLPTVYAQNQGYYIYRNYTLPIVSMTYTPFGQYRQDYQNGQASSQKVVYIFAANKNPTGKIKTYNAPVTASNTVTQNLSSFPIGNNMWIYKIEFTVTSVTYYSVDLYDTTTTGLFMPIYFGDPTGIPDDLYRYVYGTSRITYVQDDQINNTIVSGNSTSQSVQSDLNNTNNDLSSSVNSFNNLESGFVTDMNTSINNINFNNSLLTDTGLVTSMDWVRTQYWRLTNNNIIGTLVQYSLLIGLGLLILGRK